MEEHNEIHLPEGMNYSCLTCGRGCEDFEEILIDPATLERFGILPIEDLRQDRAGGRGDQPLYEESPFNRGQMMMHKVDVESRKGGARSACCFLRGDKLCALHCAHGIESKPISCRSFPFGFTETPGGTYVGLSFACSAVLQNSGASVASQLAEVHQTSLISKKRESKRKEILLAPGIPLAWGQYLAIESDLQDILAIDGAGIDTRLIAQSAYLQMLSRFLHEARGSSGAGWESDPTPNDQPLAAFRRKMKQGEGRRWERFLLIAEKPNTSPMLRRVFLGYVLAFRNARGEKLGRLGASLYVIGSYMKQAVGLGSIETPRLRAPISYRALVKIRFDPSRPEHDALLTRFLNHCLFRKDLLIEEDVRFAHNMMLMHFGLIHWYAAAFAVEAKRPEVEIDDLTEAVRTVEQYYVYHSRFAKLFTDYPMLRGIMEQMFHRPVYAFSMARHG